MRMTNVIKAVFGGIVVLVLGTACEQKASVPASSPIAKEALPESVPKPDSSPTPSPYKESTLVIPGKEAINAKAYFNQITIQKSDGEDLIFTSTGVDPYFHLPRLPEMPRGATIKIEMTLPTKQMVQLFFQKAGSAGFSEKNSLIVVQDAGRQTFEMKLPPTLNGAFRLDPGTSRGDYRIHKVEFVY